MEKGVDIALAIDMVQMAYDDTFDTAILISGDGDMAKAVEVVQRNGKHVENATTKKSLSYNLRKTCDKVIIIDDDFLVDCWR